MPCRPGGCAHSPPALQILLPLRTAAGRRGGSRQAGAGTWAMSVWRAGRAGLPAMRRLVCGGSRGEQAHRCTPPRFRRLVLQTALREWVYRDWGGQFAVEMTIESPGMPIRKEGQANRRGGTVLPCAQHSEPSTHIPPSAPLPICGRLVIFWQAGGHMRCRGERLQAGALLACRRHRRHSACLPAPFAAQSLHPCTCAQDLHWHSAAFGRTAAAAVGFLAAPRLAPARAPLPPAPGAAVQHRLVVDLRKQKAAQKHQQQ